MVKPKKRKKLVIFKDKLRNEEIWNLEEEDINVLQSEMVNCIRRLAEEVLGESRGKVKPSKEIWWWNDEVQTTIKAKRSY